MNVIFFVSIGSANSRTLGQGPRPAINHCFWVEGDPVEFCELRSIQMPIRYPGLVSPALTTASSAAFDPGALGFLEAGELELGGSMSTGTKSGKDDTVWEKGQGAGAFAAIPIIRRRWGIAAGYEFDFGSWRPGLETAQESLIHRLYLATGWSFRRPAGVWSIGLGGQRIWAPDAVDSVGSPVWLAHFGANFRANANVALAARLGVPFVYNSGKSCSQSGLPDNPEVAGSSGPNTESVDRHLPPCAAGVRPDLDIRAALRPFGQRAPISVESSVLFRLVSIAGSANGCDGCLAQVWQPRVQIVAGFPGVRVFSGVESVPVLQADRGHGIAQARRLVMVHVGVELLLGHVSAALEASRCIFAEGMCKAPVQNAGIRGKVRLSMLRDARAFPPRAKLMTRIRLEHFAEDKGLIELIEQLQTLRDTGSKGILLETAGHQFSLGQIEELSEAIIDLRRRTGMYVVVYLERGDLRDIALAGAASRVLMNPRGLLEPAGIPVRTFYLGNAFQSLGVEAEVLSTSDAKTGGERWLRDGPSDALRGQVKTILVDIWNDVVQDLGRQRGLSATQIATWEREPIVRAQRAVQLGIADDVAHYDEMEEKISEAVGRPVEIRSAMPSTRPSQAFGPKPEIAVLYVHGELLDLATSVPFRLSGQYVTADALVERLVELDRDPNVVGIVLRIDSPGGSAYAGRKVAAAIDRIFLAGRTRIFASIGQQGTSAAFMIASAAERVFASDRSIVGGIGAFAYRIDLPAFVAKYGVSLRERSIGAGAAGASWCGGATELSRELLRARLESFYEAFLHLVALRRELDVASVRCPKLSDASAPDCSQEGAVFSGARAKRFQLIDEIGGLDAAIERLRLDLRLDEIQVRTYPNLETDGAADDSIALFAAIVLGKVPGPETIDGASWIRTMLAGSTSLMPMIRSCGRAGVEAMSVLQVK